MTAISLPLISWLPLPSPLAQPWRLARSRSQGQGEVGELCPESQQCATVPAIPRGGPKDGRGLGQSRGQANPSQQEVGLRLCGAVGAQGISQGACCSLPQEGKGPAGWAGDKGQERYRVVLGEDLLPNDFPVFSGQAAGNKTDFLSLSGHHTNQD